MKDEIKKPNKLFWIYGRFMFNDHARKHRITGRVQFLMWHKGQHGHKKDCWIDSHKNHWITFKKY